ncbi:penicillin acylase family protein [Sphingomonas sp. PB4P5]|uniref:penicillin acylase family protein n=1 Tax=Parasphingomonas puruogangriensis TaxID=3096155 RepID=UPI003FA7BF06
MMRKLGKALIALLVLVAAIAIGLIVWEPLSASAAAPPPPHKYDSVIARDKFGVPHIFGKTDPDVAYGVAYAHAEDDFSTLQEAVAMARGRLGAMTGADGAKVDYALHLLGARATVDRDYLKQPADVRALLDGYATGLNTYAARHPGEVRLAKLFPVNGQDIATGFVLRTPFFFGLDQVLGALSGDTPLPRETAGPTPDAPGPLAVPAGQDAARQSVGEGNMNGSNAFVVAPSRSADGFTRVVSNSHQPWAGPVAWYELVVHSGTGWNFAGATFPGVPYPVLGHNEHLGWTNTVNRPDLVDVYKLKLGQGGDTYLFDGKQVSLQATRIWLHVKMGPFVLPIPKTVYRSVHGPVIVNKSGAFAMRYGGADQLRMVEQYYRITRAQNFAEWQKAMSLQGVSATNFLYGDAAGNIAYFYNAAFPNRKPGFDYRTVLPGDTSRDLAAGTVPWSQIPRNVNPASGFLANANNTPFQAAGAGSELKPGDYSPLLGIETDTTNRGTRSVELMGQDGSISAADLERIKYDTGVSKLSWAARWYEAVAAVDAKGDRQLIAAKALMAKWNWRFDGTNPAEALAAILLRAGQAWHYPRKDPKDPRAELATAAAYLTKHFGRIDPPLGVVLRLRHGKVDLPLDGAPDVLRAASTWVEADDGRLVVNHGDSFIMFMAWDKAGRVSSTSIQPYGAATTRPGSPHYADQAALFVAHKTKPVNFWPVDLRRNVERVYRP